MMSLSSAVGVQAGVAMGLAKTVATRFPEWGPEFATLMVGLPAFLSQPFIVPLQILCQ